MTDHRDIHEAINAVMQEVGYVQKQKSDKLTYTYLGEAGLIEAIRPSMVEHGIYASVSEIIKIYRDTYQTAKGSTMVSTVVHGKVRFTHVSGTFIDVQATGEGADVGDKSANKAMTGMYKYAIRQTFCIETGDDPDQFPSEPQERKVQPKTQGETQNPRNDTQEALGATETRESGNGMAKTAKELSDGFTGNQVLAKIELVQQLATLTGKPVVEVAKHLSGMEKGKKKTLQQIANEITGGQNVQS